MTKTLETLYKKHKRALKATLSKMEENPFGEEAKAPCVRFGKSS